jgi:hypothetical protein
MHRELGLVDGQDLNGLHEQAIPERTLTAWLTVRMNVHAIMISGDRVDGLVIDSKLLCTIEEIGR